MARIKPGRRGAPRRPTKHQQRNLDQVLAPWITPSIPSTLPTASDIDQVPKKKSGRPLTARPSGTRTSRTAYRKLPTCRD